MAVPELIKQIGRFLFERPPEAQVPVGELYRAIPGYDSVTIGTALHGMRAQGLIEATFQNDVIRLSRDGRAALHDDSLAELALGHQYIVAQYGPAAVHIVVRGERGESAGSGFFCADYPGWIVTAAHVLRDHEVLHIIDSRGDVVAQPPFDTCIGPNDLDLALILCACPKGVKPIRIEWRPDSVGPLEQLLVLGYPPLPNLHPGLDHISAQLRQVARDFRYNRDSLVISSVTMPGSSGGPVLTRRGRAVGVVDQENIGEREGEATIHAFTATPTRYLESIRALV